MRTLLPRGAEELERAANVIRGLNPDKPWRVTIAQYHAKRSNPQNDRFHALIAAVATETGNDPKYLKEWAKAQFGPSISVTVDGKTYDLPKPSSTYDTPEMTQVMDRFEAWAASELGIVV